MSFYHTLKEGAEVFFREIHPEDKAGIQEGLKLLSDSSRYTRFFAPIKKLTDKQLILLTEVDQNRHVAWVCLCPAHPEIPGLGVCRFIKTPEDDTKADFAITVIDAYQNQGLGTEFLALLYVLAEMHGVKELIGSALFSNLKLVERFKSIGAHVTWESGACDIFLPVYSSFDHFPDSNYAKIFKKLVQNFKQKISNS